MKKRGEEKRRRRIRIKRKGKERRERDGQGVEGKKEGASTKMMKSLHF